MFATGRRSRSRSRRRRGFWHIASSTTSRTARHRHSPRSWAWAGARAGESGRHALSYQGASTHTPNSFCGHRSRKRARAEGARAPGGQVGRTGGERRSTMHLRRTDAVDLEDLLLRLFDHVALDVRAPAASRLRAPGIRIDKVLRRQVSRH
jgi:hypothetical protein